MKLLNKIKEGFKDEGFDLDHESSMVQARILSPILEKIERDKISQINLAELTGFTQPLLSALFNNTKKLSMKHISLLQKGLGVVIQSSDILTLKEHEERFHVNKDTKEDGKLIQMIPKDATFFLADEEYKIEM
jgi:predicted XRE-type DNA-binding protein